MSASPLSIPSPSRLTKRKLYCGAVYFLFVLLSYDLIPPPLPPPLQFLKEFWAASGPTVVCYCVPSKRLSRQGEWKKKEKKTLLQGHTSFCFPRCLCCWLLALVLGIHSPAFADAEGGGGRGGDLAMSLSGWPDFFFVHFFSQGIIVQWLFCCLHERWCIVNLAGTGSWGKRKDLCTG